MTAIFGRMATYSGKMLKWDECLNSEIVVSPVEKYTSFDDEPPAKPDADGWYALADARQDARWFSGHWPLVIGRSTASVSDRRSLTSDFRPLAVN